MGNHLNHVECATRQHLLDAALKCFARRGYAAASVQEIVDAARVSKPVLYYYFADKAALFQAVVEAAHDERYRLVRAAAERGRTVGEKLEAIVGDLFEYFLRNREVMRLTFAAAFASADDAPSLYRCREKGRRNFDFIRALVEQGQQSGELNREFTADELAMGIYGAVNSYVMVRLLVPECALNRKAARQIVGLFLRGASTRQVTNGHARPPARERTAARAAPNRA